MGVVQGQDLEQGAGLATADGGGVAALHAEVAEEPDPQVLHDGDLARFPYWTVESSSVA